VVFDHATHAGLEGLDCVKCHGRPDEEGNYRPCQPCHRSRGLVISDQTAFHGFCRACHRKAEWRPLGAPTHCRGCHTGRPIDTRRGGARK
jgi:hypothetical protein